MSVATLCCRHFGCCFFFTILIYIFLLFLPQLSDDFSFFTWFIFAFCFCLCFFTLSAQNAQKTSFALCGEVAKQKAKNNKKYIAKLNSVCVCVCVGIVFVLILYPLVPSTKDLALIWKPRQLRQTRPRPGSGSGFGPDQCRAAVRCAAQTLQLSGKCAKRMGL